MKNFMNENKEHLYFINQLYRDFLFPTILGDDNQAILYWAGKRISRHYDLTTIEDLVEFFNEAEFGQLTSLKERRTYQSFQLSGQTVSDRLNSDSREFSLESGMIAETVSKIKNKPTECELEIKDKDQAVVFTARFS
jgi:predicted hydrocarbon binding protein